MEPMTRGITTAAITNKYLTCVVPHLTTQTHSTQIICVVHVEEDIYPVMVNAQISMEKTRLETHVIITLWDLQLVVIMTQATL